jgi:nucleoside-diphosphate-sugar epimerase
MKVLVTGVTEYIGGAVSAALTRAGHAVSALEVRDDGPVAAAVIGADAVVWTSSSSDPDREASAVGTVLDLLRDTGAAFVFTSGVWVHGDTGGMLADERTHLHPAPIVGWRADLEHQVLGARGVRGIVIRPGVVYGHGGGIPAMLVDAARRDGLVRMPGGGSNRWAVVHIDDLADLYVRAVERAPAGTVLLAVHRTELFREIAAAASDAAGAGGRVAEWPLEEAHRTLGDFADALALDQRLTSSHAIELLDWRPKHVDLLTDLRAGSYGGRAS